MNDENAPAVAEICFRLDGLPLAIELAAARIRLLTPQAMLSRLQGKLQAACNSSQEEPRTCQPASKPSEALSSGATNLLSGDEQKLFDRLSIFRGGCTLEAAEAVCDPHTDLAIDTLDGIESLVSKSLVRQTEETTGEPRFWMSKPFVSMALSDSKLA